MVVLEKSLLHIVGIPFLKIQVFMLFSEKKYLEFQKVENFESNKMYDIVT